MCDSAQAERLFLAFFFFFFRSFVPFGIMSKARTT